MIDCSAARGIADAVLYEGYLLYPYTASAPKNRLRWQFGVVVPKAHEAAGTGEHAHQQTEILFEAGEETRIEATFRFLQVEARSVEARDGNGFVPVASLVVNGTRYLTFDESLERRAACAYRPGREDSVTCRFRFDAARRIEELRDASGALVGRVVRERWPLAASLSLAALPCAGGAGIFRLRVRIENDSEIVQASQRGVVLRTALVSSHTLLGIAGGRFCSPIDPPPAALAATPELRNEHTWPVLVGDASLDAQRSTLVLSSPIVLADFPQIAKNSEADAFDGTEIDELLMLGVRSLSDTERAEARATDPRARAIVERAEAFGAADVALLHARCEAVPGSDSVPEYGLPAELAPESITIDGVVVRSGSSVRLAPKRRADAWDMFLAGKVATVQKIAQDFEDRTYVTVTIDEDPASELHEWYGRSFFFEPDEVEPLGDAP